MQGSIPGSWDHDLSLRQTRNNWATQALLLLISNLSWIIIFYPASWNFSLISTLSMAQREVLGPSSGSLSHSPKGIYWGTWVCLNLAGRDHLHFNIKFPCFWKVPWPFRLPRALVSIIVPNTFLNVFSSPFWLHSWILAPFLRRAISSVLPSNLRFQGFPVHQDQLVKGLSPAKTVPSFRETQVPTEKRDIFAHPIAHRLRYPLCQNLLRTTH